MKFHLAHNNGKSATYSQVGILQTFSTGQPEHEVFDTFDEWITRLKELGVDTSEIEEQKEDVPQSVEKYKLEIVLDNENILDSVETMISQADRKIKLAWGGTPTVRRDSPTLKTMADALGLSGSDVDRLFVLTKKVVI